VNEGGDPTPDPLRPVSLPELRLQADGRCWQVDQPVEGLSSLTPVRGSLAARHHGAALELKAQVATIVTLCCDRCLQHFNHPLRAEVEEVVEIRTSSDPSPFRAEAAFRGEAVDLAPASEDLDDRLDAEGRFDPERWLFEQLSLQLPLVNRCGPDCPGPATWSSEPAGGDPRWAALQRLKS